MKGGAKLNHLSRPDFMGFQLASLMGPYKMHVTIFTASDKSRVCTGRDLQSSCIVWAGVLLARFGVLSSKEILQVRQNYMKII